MKIDRDVLNKIKTKVMSYGRNVYHNVLLCIAYGRWYLPFAIYCLPTDLSNKDPVYQFEPNIATENVATEIVSRLLVIPQGGNTTHFKAHDLTKISTSVRILPIVV